MHKNFLRKKTAIEWIAVFLSWTKILLDLEKFREYSAKQLIIILRKDTVLRRFYIILFFNI